MRARAENHSAVMSVVVEHKATYTNFTLFSHGVERIVLGGRTIRFDLRGALHAQMAVFDRQGKHDRLM